MSKKHYIVNCYTCQHNGQETCKGCRTLLVGEDEPYENWQLREDLEQKDNKIADLEAKIAESEKENKRISSENLSHSIYVDKKIERLEQQLALKETELGNMQSMCESVTKSSAKCFKENIELREQLTESQNTVCEHIVELTKIATEKDRQIEELKQQLAEKDVELEDLRKMRERFLKLKEQKPKEFELLNLRDDVEGLLKELAEKKKEVETLQHYNDRLAQGIYHSYGEHFILKVKQDKISFAVDKLKKLKDGLSSMQWCFTGRRNFLQEVEFMRKSQEEMIDEEIEELLKEIKGE